MFRLILFSGLVFHKAVWEVLKRRDGVSSRPRREGVRLVKWIKTMVLIFLGYQTLFLEIFPIAQNATPLKIIGTSVYFLGLTTAVIGRMHLGRNWADLEDYQVLEKQSLVTTGIYRYIRHPIYTGDILFLIGLELALNSWLVLLVSVPLVVVIKQALAEEALLSKFFSDYDTYRRKTKRFIPFVV